MTMPHIPARGLLARIRDALFAAERSAPEEQDTDALQQVTQWAWLPALSGVAVSGVTVAADHARSAREATVRGRAGLP
jgi:hypothetical protein